MELIYEDFVKLAEDKKEIGMKKEIVNGEELTIFCYNISTPGLFDTELARECRGIVFNSTGECICRPYKKFFNIGERTETLPKNIDWNNLSVYTTKWDGSLVTPVMVNGEIFFKTKKTFYSFIADRLNTMWKEKGPFYRKYSKIINRYDLNEVTLLFEYVDPEKQIVIRYDKEELIFLGERNIKTGYFYPSPDIIEGVIPNKSYDKNWSYIDFIEGVKQEKNIEGYVIYDKTRTQAYKIKCEWYLDRHHLLSSLSYRTILRLITEDKIDDIISELRIKGFSRQVETVEKICKEYSVEWDDLYVEMHTLFSFIMKDKHLTKKEFAIIVTRSYNFYQGLLFNLYDNDTERLTQNVQEMVVDKLKEKYKGQVMFLGEVQ